MCEAEQCGVVVRDELAHGVSSSPLELSLDSSVLASRSNVLHMHQSLPQNRKVFLKRCNEVQSFDLYLF